MKIVKNFNNLDEILEVLKKGGLVIFPCETVYGIACDSQNEDAVKKLNKYKKRPLGKPYAIMASSSQMAKKYVDLNESAQTLYKEFLPGPLTVVSKGKGKVAKGIESENKTLGVRIPDYKDMLNLIEKFGRPIVATSANASYKKRPYEISDILNNISKKQMDLIDLIIDVGKLPLNEPSTVIDTTLDQPTTLRLGQIKLQNENEVFSTNEESTQNVAKELFQKYCRYQGSRPIIFALEGEMGAGKTIFTKGLAKAIGIKDEITSPTFNLLLQYEDKLTHIDAWRIRDEQDLNSLGFVKFLENKNMILSIEWADRVIDVIKKYRDQAVIVWVKMKYGRKENERLISWGIL